MDRFFVSQTIGDAGLFAPPRPPFYKALLFVVVVAFSLIPVGCGTSPLHPKKDTWLNDSDRLAVLKAIAQSQPSPKAADPKRAVRIFAQDIRLPESTPGAEQTEYYFYVWASHPYYPGVSVDDLLKEGILEIDVVGAQAERRVARTPSSASQAQQIPEIAFQNGQVVEFVVRAGDITGPIRIAAWYPLEYRLFGTPGKSTVWSDCQALRTYAGDLTTRIQIVDQTEARASFGAEFPRRFYVGRVFMRNNNPEKKLIVYTTSMRVPVYLYRRNEGFAKEFGRLKKVKTSPPLGELIPPKRSDQPEGMAVNIDLPKQNEDSAKSLYQTFYDSLDAVWNYTEQSSTPPIQDWLTDYLTQANSNVCELKKEKKRLVAIEKDLAPPKLQKCWKEFANAPLEPKTFSKLKALCETLDKTQGAEILENARKLQANARKLEERRKEIDFLENRTLRTPRMLAHFMALLGRAGVIGNGSAQGSPWDAQMGIRTGFVDSANPLNRDLEGEEHPVLLSGNRDVNYALNAVGFAKRDLSRPMTYQAVLNSLILSQNEANRSRTVKMLQMAGRLAGGTIALSPLVPEFGREGWSRAVGFYSATFTPEMADLLLEDLNAHIRNLSDMSMDTVMVIGPRNSVDRYVFFPRGPIYNYPDEADVRSPSFIVKVLDEEVQVQAELVEGSVQLDFAKAGTLSESAVNAGKASAASELAKQADQRAKLANAELSRALGRMEKLLLRRASLKQAGASAEEILPTEAAVRSIVRDYRATYGTSGDAAFKQLMEQYQMSMDNAAPKLGPLPDLKLPAGARTAWMPLPLSDLETSVSELKVNAESATANISWSSRNSDENKPEYSVAATQYALTNNEGDAASFLIVAKDSAGETAKANQKIALYGLAAQSSLKPGTELNVEKGKLFVWDLSFDIGDADPSGWTLKLTDGNGKGIDVRPTELPLRSSAAKSLGATLSIDASNAKAGDTPKLTFEVRQGDKAVIAGQTVTLKVKDSQ